MTPRLPVADLARSIDFTPTEERPGRIGDAELYVRVSGAQALHAELRRHIPVEWGPEIYSYGRMEFAVRDPDSYLVIFTEPTEEPPTTHEP